MHKISSYRNCSNMYSLEGMSLNIILTSLQMGSRRWILHCLLNVSSRPGPCQTPIQRTLLVYSRVDEHPFWAQPIHSLQVLDTALYMSENILSLIVIRCSGYYCVTVSHCSCSFGSHIWQKCLYRKALRLCVDNCFWIRLFMHSLLQCNEWS